MTREWKKKKKDDAWSNESWFLLRHADGTVRVWQRQHASMGPPCLMSTGQAGGGVAVCFLGSLSVVLGEV